MRAASSCIAQHPHPRSGCCAVSQASSFLFLDAVLCRRCLQFAGAAICREPFRWYRAIERSVDVCMYSCADKASGCRFPVPLRYYGIPQQPNSRIQQQVVQARTSCKGFLRGFGQPDPYRYAGNDPSRLWSARPRLLIKCAFALRSIQ
jgi:hypothetical protein